MWSFYVFMMWFLSITLWKNVIGAIFAKIWSVVKFFGLVAHKPEHTSQGELDSIHGQNLPNHEDLEMLLSELTNISLGIEISTCSSDGQFIYTVLAERGDELEDRILAKIGGKESYFAVLDHISSSMTINTLWMTLKFQKESDDSTSDFNPFNPLRTMSEHRQKELSDYLEAFWKALASNKSLENVHVHVGSLERGQFIPPDKNAINDKVPSGVGIANWIAKVLYENKTISKLRLTFNCDLSVQAARILSRALLANRTLKTLQLSPSSVHLNHPYICGESMKILLEPLRGRGDRYNNILEHLSVSHPTDDNGVEHIATMLTVNDSLKGVRFTRAVDGKTRNGVSKIGDALINNHSLQELNLIWMELDPDECKALFKPLMQDDSRFQANTSLKTLNLDSCELGQVGFEYLTAMIERNSSLINLDVAIVDVLDGKFSTKSFNGCEENVCLLLESLKGHPSIEDLSIYDCKGVQGDKVLGTFMDLLLENNHLQDVDLRLTPLYNSGNAEKIHIELKKRREENSWGVIKDMAKAHAKSGRIFLCGDGEAGKTTLCTTLKEINEMKKHSKMGSSQSNIPLFSSQTKMVVNERTRGIEVHNLSYDDVDLTIWDMAGQEEYHSFHDLVIPNLSGAGSACTFILVCNPLQDTLDEIKSKLQYWLQFIASNTRKSRLYRPCVTITMTHCDLWSHKGPIYYGALEDEVETLKKLFNDLLEFDTDKGFYAMDARQSNGIATQLFEFMIDQMKSLLAKLPKVLKACFELQQMVKDWNIQHPNQPFLSWDEFSSKICEQVKELKVTSADMELVERRRKRLALSLHDGGHIIYNEDIEFVIMNPHWFCHDVMGELLSQFHDYLKRPDLRIISRGSMTSVNFKRILSSLRIIGDERHAYTQDFVSILTKLQICYDQGDDTFMVPSTLPQRGELLKWSSSEDTMKTNYIGRRLAPRDIQRTILSAGFFPRLQVYFQKKINDDNTRKTYKLTKDTISFIENGKEVVIEYDGHIDVMVRSIQNKDILLQFLHGEVFSVIYELLGNPTLGCPGVILVECVLRPLCVQKLIKKEHRRDQFVLLESLKEEVLKCYDLDYCHNWNDSEGMEQGYNNATDLLGQEEWGGILGRRREALNEIGTLVLSSLPSTSAPVDSKDHAISGSEPIDRAPILELILSEVQSVKKIVVETMSLTQQQDKMLYGIYASINESMQFSVELQKAQIPRLACLAIHTKMGKKQLFRRFIPGLTKCDLHFFCEHIHGIHEVDGQTGLPVYFGTKATKRVMSLLARGLNIVTILTKVAAHVGGGLGSLVPDLAQGASLILDTPGLLDHQLPNTSSVHILSEDLGKSQVIPDEDMKDAERWLINEVSKVGNIHSMYGLNRVKYSRRHFGDQMKTPLIAWVCDEHKEDGVSRGTLEPLSYC